MDWMEIFKTGKHTDSQGNEREWNEKDLDTIVSKYNPSEHEAPVVIGHPTNDAPAYGWVEALKRDGSTLYAKVKQLVPEFVNAVKAGMYKKRSISLYPDLSLKHIGFLGAAPPAIKGLADVKFSAGDNATTIDFTASDADKKAQEERSKKYGISIIDGGNVTKPSKYESVSDEDFADPVNYAYPIDEDHVQAALSYWGKPENRSAYSKEDQAVITKRILTAAKKQGKEVDPEKWKFTEGGNDMELEAKVKDLEAQNAQKDEALKVQTKQITEFSEKVKTSEKELADAKAALARIETDKRHAEYVSFCEELVKAGKLTAAQRTIALDFMEIAFKTGEYEFAEAEGKTSKSPALDKFKALLQLLPKQVEFSEVATRGTDGTGSPDPAMIAEQAREFMKKEHEAGRDITYTAAVNHVIKGR